MLEGDILMEQPEKQGFKIGEVIIIVIITCTFSIFAGISYGKIKYSNTVNINGLDNDGQQTPLNEFIQNYDYILENYYDGESIDEEALLNSALAAILNKLGVDDPYSLYMSEDDYNNFNITLEGEYKGLGIGVLKENDDSYILISYILDNSPASKLDVKAGDYIVAIDGKDTSKMTSQEFSEYVVNGDDEQFLLKIKREDKEFNVNIKKDKIELESVSSKVFDKDDKKIGYIGVSVFASNTYNQFKGKLAELEKKGVNALIIDVRGNTGGQLTEVSKMLSLFLDKEKVIYQMKKNKEKAVKYYSSGDITKDYPIVFLSDANTASASEVLILGLRENINAKVVGTKTYGKGTVQDLVDLSNGDKYKITTKRWLSPNGNWVNDTEGIVPDVEVKLDKKYFDNPTDENDNQLQEAIKVAFEQLVK